MKKFFIFIFLTFFLQSSLYSYSSNPKDFVNELVNDALENLSNENLKKNEKEKFI